MARGTVADGVSPRAAAAFAAALLLALASLGAAGAPAAARDLGSGACLTPDTLLGSAFPLPRVAARLKAGQTLKIVAIGSSSTGGAGASSPAHAYPARLREALARHFPESAIEVANKGVNGQRTPAMIARFERDVFAERPDLVIWQLGTNAIIQKDGVAGNEALIRDGIGRLKAAKVDIILIDPQFAPKVTTDPDYREMLRIIDAVAQSERVTVFPRFAVMRHWVSSGQATLAEIVSRDGLHMNDLSYGCLAGLLADQIDIAVRGESRQLIAAPQPRP
jgi:lysophospholipase L1-like esterase